MEQKDFSAIELELRDAGSAGKNIQGIRWASNLRILEKITFYFSQLKRALAIFRQTTLTESLYISLKSK